MTQEELHQLARQRPFQPFRLILTTGEVLEIRHPDLIMVGRRSAVIGLTNKPNGVVYDRTMMVELLHVVGAELFISPPSGNGPPA